MKENRPILGSIKPSSNIGGKSEDMLFKQSIEYVSGKDDMLDYVEKLVSGDTEGEIFDNYGYFITGKETFIPGGKKLSTIVMRQTLSDVGDYSIWVSNLQKCIRRGKIDNALYSFLVIAGMGEQYTSNIMNRVFKVMVSEDLFGSSLLTVICSDIMLQYNVVSTQNKYKFVQDNWILISDTVKLMCEGMKSRVVDLVIHYLGGNKIIEITDERLCMDAFDYVLDNLATEYTVDNITYNLNDILSSSATLSKTLNASKLGPELAKKFSRKKKIQYYYFYRLLDIALDIDLEFKEHDRFVTLIIESLMNLFPIGSEEKLSIFHAFILVFMFKKQIILKIEPLIPEVRYDKTIDQTLALDIMPDIVSIDSHTVVGRKAGIKDLEFYLYGSKITNPYPQTFEFENKLFMDILNEIMKESTGRMKI